MKIILYIAVLCAAALAASAENLVKNAGFEVATPKGGAELWSAPQEPYSFVAGEGQNGTRALRFDVKKESPYAFPSQVVALEPGRAYVAEAWVRAEALEGNEAGGAIAVEWRKPDGGWLGGNYSVGIKGSSGGFRKITLAVNVPTNAGSCTISAYVPRGMTGKAWFDDLSIIPAERPLLGAFVTDVYRNTAVSGDVNLSVVVNMPPDELVEKGARAYFDILSAATSRRTVEVPVVNGAARTKVDVCELAAGETEMQFRLMDAKGAQLASKSLIFTRPVPKGQRPYLAKMPRLPVRIERNRTLFNGAPFYPLGMFVSKIEDSVIADLKKGAFNCVLAYNPPTRKQMDAAHAAGLKVIYSIKDAYLGTRSCPAEIIDEASEIKWVTERIAAFKDHPALLAWYINDELGIELKERLTARRDLVEKLDPGHPAYVALYQMDILKEYLGTFDVIGSDPYPICQTGDPPISQVAEHTRITRETIFGGMAMWQIPQIFDWGCYRKKDVEKTRAPTFEEMRNMAWQFIAEGAMGLVPYAYHPLKHMDWRDKFDVQWKKVCDISHEIAASAPVFLSEEPPVAVGGIPQGMSVRAWHYAGKDYVLCVNTTREPLAAELDVEVHGKVPVSLAGLGFEMKTLTPPPFTAAKEGFFIAAEQRADSVVAFDGRTPGRHPYVWEWNAARDPGVAKEYRKFFGCMAECKLISTECGDAVIAVGSAGGFAEIPLAAGRAVCYGKVNLSPHSIAKLPGNMKYAIASAISNEITVVDCAVAPLEPDKQPQRRFFLLDAHGTEWDEKRGCLWALGGTNLVKYAWDPEKLELKRLANYDFRPVGGRGGHDLVPDGAGGYFLSTGASVLRFYPDEGRFEFIRHEHAVKCLSPSPVWGEATVKTREIWWTDRILVRQAGKEHVIGPYPGARFYKARWMK